MCRLFLIVVSAGILSACASSPGDDLPPFGLTVNEVIQAQTYRIGDSVPAMSGDKAGNVMEAYRQRGKPRPGTQIQDISMEIYAK